MITLLANQQNELARGMGNEITFAYNVVSGSAEVIAYSPDHEESEVVAEEGSVSLTVPTVFRGSLLIVYAIAGSHGAVIDIISSEVSG